MQTMTGMMALSGLDPIQALIVGQRQFGGVLDEIESRLTWVLDMPSQSITYCRKTA